MMCHTYISHRIVWVSKGLHGKEMAMEYMWTKDALKREAERITSSFDGPSPYPLCIHKHCLSFISC